MTKLSWWGDAVNERGMSRTCSESEGELWYCREKGSYCEEGEKIEMIHSRESWRREERPNALSCCGFPSSEHFGEETSDSLVESALPE
jgi:hypothetical protein